MSLSILQVLADNRDALLLAEVAAWLHDMGKCADEHIINQASDKPQNYSYRYKTAQTNRLPVTLKDIKLLGETVSVKDLIEQGMPRVIGDASRPWLLRALGKCHAVSHVEKELSESDAATKQPKDDTRLSSAYGMEGDAVKRLTALLDALPFQELINRTNFVSKVEAAFDCALGDTRRPVNEVTLADWSGAVAALYKSALASALLGVKPDPDALRWRILRVNFDVLALYAKAVKIADLLGYQRAVDQACQRVKQLVEEEYPLGNEIYRDTTGIYFTFPDLDLPADLTHEIRRRVEEVEPELAPRIDITVSDGTTAVEQLKGILGKAHGEARQALAQPFDAQNLNRCWQQLWETIGDGTWELCPVCRLRPMKEGEEACEYCDARRGSRIKDWEGDPAQTIWMDELADHNDRVALLVGKFGLDDWLSGDLVQTMLVKAEQNNPAGCAPKNPSPARLRRVWETCARFWTETVERDILAQHEYGKDTQNAQRRCTRWLIVPDKKNGWKENVPYDGIVNGKPISLLWRDDTKYFVTIINLQLIGELKQGHAITVSDPDEPRKQIAFSAQGVMQAMGNLGQYTPFLPLLSSPDQFLAFVPAADALKIAEKIRAEYTRQLGKVQNRLPLFMGIVFFPRKMPLMAVMDAARRMLTAQVGSEQWLVDNKTVDSEEGLVNGKTVKHQVCALKRKKDGREMMLRVPTLMGDGTTEDKWYPYFQVERFADGTPDHRTYCFEHNGHWFVRVNDLKQKDVVYVTPSRFAYLWLEHTAKRFEFDVEKDALLLDDLPRLMEMWKKIRGIQEMTDTKLRGVQALLETKGATWGEASGEFTNLAQTTFQHAGMLDTIAPEDVTSGRFARCLELYTKILKQKVKED